MFRTVIFFAATLFIAALSGCDSNSVSSEINAPQKAPLEKPSARFSNQIFLPLSGLIDLHQVLALYRRSESKSDCIHRSSNRIQWNCPEKKFDSSLTKKGILYIQKLQGGDLITNLDLPLKMNIRLQGQILPIQQDIEISVQDQYFQSASTYSYSFSRSGKLIQYRISWILNGQFSAENMDSLENLKGTYSVTRVQDSRQSSSEVDLVSLTSLRFVNCGQIEGSIQIQSPDQKLLKLNSNGQILRAEGTPIKYQWPSCHDSLYHLVVGGTFLRQVETQPLSSPSEDISI